MTGAADVIFITADEFLHFEENGCPSCGLMLAPEPTDEERKELWENPDLTWEPPPGVFMSIGYGLAFGGGFGTWLACECGWAGKHVRPEEETL